MPERVKPKNFVKGLIQLAVEKINENIKIFVKNNFNGNDDWKIYKKQLCNCEQLLEKLISIQKA